MKFVIVDNNLYGVSDVNFVKALETLEAEGSVDFSDFGKAHGEITDMTGVDAAGATELLTDIRAEREEKAKAAEKKRAEKRIEALKAKLAELESEGDEPEAAEA